MFARQAFAYLELACRTASTDHTNWFSPALFDTARHGLAHRSQQIPVKLTDGKLWRLSFSGVEPGQACRTRSSTPR